MRMRIEMRIRRKERSVRTKIEDERGKKRRKKRIIRFEKRNGMRLQRQRFSRPGGVLYDPFLGLGWGRNGRE